MTKPDETTNPEPNTAVADHAGIALLDARIPGLHLVALSGGKDSTALALRLAEVRPDINFTYFCTPTGDELPDMEQHWQHLGRLLGKPILRLHHKLDLHGLIDFYGALPNWRQRWCTRQLKIEVAKAHYLKHPGSVAYVGLRADEPERVGGIYGDIVEQRYPLREWGWGLSEVLNYLHERGITIPRRTDCARCYDQRIGEWWDLWKDYPDIYAHAEAQEIKYGHTFRSPARDKWPAALVDLRKDFESGQVPRGASIQHELFIEERCRACSL
jgi:hypothetical protein